MTEPAKATKEADRTNEALGRFTADPTPTLLRRAAAWIAVGTSRLLLKRLNTFDIHDKERLAEARRLQRPGHGLLTVSNHVGLFDDPLVLACIVKPHWADLRWIAADAINFFSTPAMALFSNSGKAVPVVRGAGADQMGMNFLVERLHAGDWVHVFPEGGRSREPGAALRLPLKQGVAYLVSQARPLLLAFHHSGMQDVLPIGAYVPRVGNRLSLRFDAVLDTNEGLADQDTATIMEHIEASLLGLQAKQTLGADRSTLPPDGAVLHKRR